MNERSAKLNSDGLPTAVFFGSAYHLECDENITLSGTKYSVSACGIRYTNGKIYDGSELGHLSRMQMCGRCLASKAFKKLSPESIGWEP